MDARCDLVLACVRDASLEPELLFEPLVAEPIGVFVRQTASTVYGVQPAAIVP